MVTTNRFEVVETKWQELWRDVRECLVELVAYVIVAAALGLLWGVAFNAFRWVTGWPQ